MNSILPNAELLGPQFRISVFPQQHRVTLQAPERSVFPQLPESQAGLELQLGKDGAS